MNTELATLTVHGTEVHALGDYLFPQSMAEVMGLDWEGQRQRITESAWSEGMTCRKQVILPTDTKGATWRFAMHHRIVPMWIAGINARRVRPEVRPVVEAWQREIAEVLAEHYYPGVHLTPGQQQCKTMTQVRALEARGYEVVGWEPTCAEGSYTVQRVSEVDKVQRFLEALPQAAVQIQQADANTERALNSGTRPDPSREPGLWRKVVALFTGTASAIEGPSVLNSYDQMVYGIYRDTLADRCWSFEVFREAFRCAQRTFTAQELSELDGSGKPVHMVVWAAPDNFLWAALYQRHDSLPGFYGHVRTMLPYAITS